MCLWYTRCAKISIHALREEGDRLINRPVTMAMEFLSTPSARRATHPSPSKIHCVKYFYPRPPRGGRPCCSVGAANMEKFLSTPSARRATVPPGVGLRDYCISIHALREEGDGRQRQRGPGGGISIHALREEGDAALLQGPFMASNFYPRPPRGGRLQPVSELRISVGISIHALREEGDRSQTIGTHTARKNFYPRPPRGGRLCPGVIANSIKNFYPRPPRGGRRHSRLCRKEVCRISIHALREEGDGPASHPRRRFY